MLLSKLLKRLPPPGMLAVLYAILIAAGAVALKLPWSHHGHITWSDAIFTSTSAVTVTGLGVVNTGTDFSYVGQGIIAALVQMGGLGLMTFTVLLLSALGISVGIPQRLILREDLKQTSLEDVTGLARIVLTMALVVELVGAALLALVFVPDFGLAEGLWHAVFHSISAFNNAGFSTFPDSLSRWVADPIVNIVIPTMFIMSGLGFVVLADIMSKRRWLHYSLHTKLMVAGTVCLIFFAWGMFALLEWNNPGTLGGLDGWFAKLQASFFHAVTPRTAGFNTVDTAAMDDSTALLTIGLMMIGGGSASTAGGIKVTTAIVLVLGTIAFFRQRSELNAFNRSLGNREVLKVMALTSLSTALIFVALFLLLIGHQVGFLQMAFEVVSAFGTVGLSMGATSELNDFGRAVICLVMFLGRVGPLSLGFFLATQGTTRVRYPAGQVYLG